MRMSSLLSQTLREAPSDAEIPSHSLLVRAGYIRQLAAGIFTVMPLAKRSLTKIEDIMREEINAIGGQEMAMPVIHPAEIWKKTGRWGKVGPEMGRFQDRNGRDMVLAMTHEETVVDVIKDEIQSYRQLPMLIYHIQTKWRDDPRPRAGLIRVREFTMKDSYSLDRDWEGLDRQYRAHYQTYFDIFNRCKLPVIAVESDVGMMGGNMAHEFMYLTPVGEDTLLLCDQCGYSANRQIADFQKQGSPPEEPLEREKVATPAAKTIADLTEYLDLPARKTSKVVFLMATMLEDGEDVEKLVFAIVRGDMDLNETKLANAIGAKQLRPAEENEIKAVGAVPGYASPIGLDQVMIVVDDLIPETQNLVAGANEEGYHFLNVNYGRDYQAEMVVDIAAAKDGDACPRCGEPLNAVRGIEVGNIFKLGTWYSEAADATFQNEQGKEEPVVMGSYGIGSGRLLASVVEEHHDDYGMILPITIAPYEVHLVSLEGKKSEAEEVRKFSEKLYRELREGGLEVLYDDRDESPGVKFNDADLIGCPVRLTVGSRSLEKGGVEVKLRHQKERNLIPVDEIVDSVREKVDQLYADINENLEEVELES
ncbi:MAG: proline--tRNA ligase [Anaerolineales bacterium]|nr:proline--tRNA ligase [Anaerolineales bacterium]